MAAFCRQDSGINQVNTTNRLNVDIAILNQGPDLIDTQVWWDVREK